MKRFILPIALALSACTVSTPVPTMPASVANAIVLDEQVALATELSYQAAATAVLAMGLASKPSVKAADRRAYVAVTAVRAAYDAGNATDYTVAAITARKAVTDLLTAIKG